MTPTTSPIARIIVTAMATALVLTGCGSAASSDPTPADAPVAPSAVATSAAPANAESPMAPQPATTAAPPSADSAAVEPSGPGAYITWAQYQGSKDMYDSGDVVLFFHASWCPTCRATQENLEADPAAIRPGLAIVKVDYDDSDDLRQAYGVTTQHTFVQVDGDGDELAKWTGSQTADEIAQQLT